MAFIVGTAAGETLQGTAGADRIQGLNGVDTLVGLQGDDVLFGGGGIDFLQGGPGDDFLFGGAGFDLANYRNALGAITVSMAALTVQGEGTDELLGIEGVFGTAFADTFIGGDGDDQFAGGGGNDRIEGGAGSDTAAYTLAASAVTVNLATGVVTGPDGADTLISIENAVGSAFNDTLIGTADANRLRGNGGDDVLDGAGGFDTVDYFNAAAGVTVDLASGVAIGAGNDTLSNIEAVIGSEFADTLIGNAQANTLDGLGGDDVLDGGAGDDTLIGGAGFDFADYRTAGAAVMVNLLAGTASGGAGNDTLSGIEAVIGSAFADTLVGDAGVNFLRGMGGNDILDGGDGNDLADYRNTTLSITAAMATGTVTVSDGSVDTLVRIEGVYGSQSNDTITGGAGDDLIGGHLGNDTLSGGAGFDTVAYRSASGGVTVSLFAGTASGADGNDTLSGFEAIVGGGFGDTLTGDAANNTLNGRGGDDTLDGGGGTDTASYADAVSAVTVNLGAGTASGGDGSDTLVSIENALGSASGDTLIGSSGVNLLQGGGGNDVLDGRGGNDTLDGGDGFDIVSYANASAAVSVNLATGAVSGSDGGDTLISIEGVYGSAFDDTLTGDDLGNFLRGNAGNDRLDGGEGTDFADYQNAPSAVTVNLSTGAVGGGDGSDTLVSIEAIRGSAFDDTLTGGAGTNWFRGRGGNDRIDGGIGEDWADFSQANNGVFVNLLDGTASGEGDDTLLNIEHVRGSAFDDWLIGDNGINLFRPGAGDDLIDGGDGADVVDYTDSAGAVVVDLFARTADGVDGHDTLRSIMGAYGTAFVDTLIGNDDDNAFRGGASADTIHGGEGQDVAMYNDAPEAITVNLATGVRTGWAAEDVLESIEGIYGTRFDDVLIGDARDNLFRGDDGNDTIDGGAGVDTADYRGTDAGVTVNLAAGTASGDAGSDTLVGIENVRGSTYADVIIGDAGDNVIRGREGNDTLEGGAGFDVAEYTQATGAMVVNLATGTVSGPDGADTLSAFEGVSGSAYGDTLTGSAGDNTLQGNAGDDRLEGGAGVDTAVYEGVAATFSFARSGTQWILHDVSASEGTDTLTGIERLAFADKTLELVNLPRTGVPAYGVNPGFLFDAVYYLLDNTALVPTVTRETALQHYFSTGAAQGLDPNSWFDPVYYANRWADLKPLNLDDATLFMHYNLYGVWEGRSAGPKFDTFDGNRYLTDNPDVAAYVDAFIGDFLGSRTNGAIAHYVIYGSGEQRAAFDTAGVQIDLGYVLQP